MGPPTSGGLTVIQILKLLENKKLDKYPPLSVEAVHLFTQASKLAYADRGKYMADADFVSVPVEGLIDEGYLKERSTLSIKKKTWAKQALVSHRMQIKTGKPLLRPSNLVPRISVSSIKKVMDFQ